MTDSHTDAATDPEVSGPAVTVEPEPLRHADNDPDTLAYSTGFKRVDALILAMRGRSTSMLRFLRLVGYPACVALVAYVGYRASKGVSFDSLRAWPIAVSVVLFAIYWMMLGKGWEIIAGEPISRQGMAIWCKTQVLRYVPGSLLAPAARATSVQGRKRDKLATVIGEQVTMVAAGTSVAGVLMALSGSLVFLPLVLTAAVPFALHHAVRGKTALTNRRMAHAGVWYVVAFLIYAAANIFAQVGVGPTSNYLRIGGAGCLAWALGVIVIFAPGGLGAREAFYVKLVGNRLGVGLPSAGAVTGRLSNIVAELIVLVAFVGPHHLFQRRRDQAAAALAEPAPTSTENR